MIETFPPSPGITSPFDWAKNRKPSIFANDRNFAPLGVGQQSREVIQQKARETRQQRGTDKSELSPLSNKGKCLDQLGRKQIDLAPKTAGAISLKKYSGKPGLAKSKI
jgi:hypothetical protein